MRGARQQLVGFYVFATLHGNSTTRIKVNMPSPVKDAYLVVYNLACAGGWSYVLLACVSHILAGSEPQALYDEIEKVLQVVQTAALMEVRQCLPATTGVALFTCAML